jgi:hypothetical protein
MDYRQKYLKYKNKYIQLKQIGLGKPTFKELLEECDTQMTTNRLSGCTECIYQHTANEGAPRTHLTHSYGLPSTIQGCISQADNSDIFNSTLRAKTNLLNIDGSITPLTPPHTIDIELDTNRYTNPELSYRAKIDNPIDNDVICAEGNIVYVTPNSRVASTTIDSCLFVIIILTNGCKMCIHHNILDVHPFVEQKNFSDINSFLFSNIRGSLTRNNLTIDRFYFCGFNQTHNYDNLISIYKKLNPSAKVVTFYNTPFRFLVNNVNQVVYWTSFRSLKLQ